MFVTTDCWWCTVPSAVSRGIVAICKTSPTRSKDMLPFGHTVLGSVLRWSFFARRESCRCESAVSDIVYACLSWDSSGVCLDIYPAECWLLRLGGGTLRHYLRVLAHIERAATLGALNVNCCFTATGVNEALVTYVNFVWIQSGASECWTINTGSSFVWPVLTIFVIQTRRSIEERCFTIWKWLVNLMKWNLLGEWWHDTVMVRLSPTAVFQRVV